MAGVTTVDNKPAIQAEVELTIIEDLHKLDPFKLPNHSV
jgi:hypothetical protein